MLSEYYYFEGAGSQGAGEFTLFTCCINSLSKRDCGIVLGSLAGLEAMVLYLAYR